MICQKNVAARVRGLIFLYICIENFKIKIFVRNHWTDFIITWQKCFLVDPLPRLFKLSWFIKKTFGDPLPRLSKSMAARGRGLISLYIYIMIVLSETTGPISVKHCRNVSFVTLYQDCSSRHDLPKKRGCQGAGLNFPIYLYRKL